tara:strand:+ start:760 stop:1089 length:330 start_codon:yes stop_codon:yes gene_type:complete
MINKKPSENQQKTVRKKLQKFKDTKKFYKKKGDRLTASGEKIVSKIKDIGNMSVKDAAKKIINTVTPAGAVKNIVKTAKDYKLRSPIVKKANGGLALRGYGRAYKKGNR